MVTGSSTPRWPAKDLGTTDLSPAAAAGFKKMLDDDGFFQRRHYSVASSNSDSLGDRCP